MLGAYRTHNSFVVELVWCACNLYVICLIVLLYLCWALCAYIHCLNYNSLTCRVHTVSLTCVGLCGVHTVSLTCVGLCGVHTV